MVVNAIKIQGILQIEHFHCPRLGTNYIQWRLIKPHTLTDLYVDQFR